MFSIRYTTATEVAAAEPRIFKFPGGESHVVLPQELLSVAGSVVGLTITALLKTADNVMQLFLLTDALRRECPMARVELLMPYAPYARQDRVTYAGEPLSAKVFCNLINAQGYDRVIVVDPHSDVTPALLDRVAVVTAEGMLRQVLADAPFKNGVTLLAPDAGARKRTLSLAQKLGVPDVGLAEKMRDPRTGQISGTYFPKDIPANQPVLVVDDICDGGRTFVELAKAGREVCDNPLYLYVTHGLFSKGLAELKDNFKKVYAAYDWTNATDEQLVVVSY